MDVEKLIERLKEPDCDECTYEEKRECAGSAKCVLSGYAAEALSTLQAENEKLRAELEQKEKYYEQMVDALAATESAELEQVKRERDALIDDFVDYVTGGVPNPAIFCKNRCDKCTDMRGWCTGKDCKGFYPSGASGQKED